MYDVEKLKKLLRMNQKKLEEQAKLKADRKFTEYLKREEGVTDPKEQSPGKKSDVSKGSKVYNQKEANNFGEYE